MTTLTTGADDVRISATSQLLVLRAIVKGLVLHISHHAPSSIAATTAMLFIDAR